MAREIYPCPCPPLPLSPQLSLCPDLDGLRGWDASTALRRGRLLRECDSPGHTPVTVHCPVLWQGPELSCPTGGRVCSPCAVISCDGHSPAQHISVPAPWGRGGASAERDRTFPLTGMLLDGTRTEGIMRATNFPGHGAGYLIRAPHVRSQSDASPACPTQRRDSSRLKSERNRMGCKNPHEMSLRNPPRGSGNPRAC